MTLSSKTLGAGLSVAAQGLGCFNLTGGAYGGRFEEQMALDTVHRALDLGVTLFDTADSYGGSDAGFGANEEFLGRAIWGRRNQIVLATKFGSLGVGPGQPLRGDAAYVRSACEGSLQRLRVDHIDLYYCHRTDPQIAIEETVGAMSRLVEEGKVRFIGLSTVSSETLRRAAQIHSITALESEWSLWSRDIEEDVLPTARALGVGLVPFAPLGRGFLTGKLRSEAELAPHDYRRTSPRFQGENFTRNLTLVQAAHNIAAEKGCSLAQLALAWLHSQGPDVVPIPGADRPEYVTENVEALDLELLPSDLARVDSAFPFGVAAGERYADMSQVEDRTTRH